MSIDLNWSELTSEPDGRVFEESVRAFIHAKFQQTSLPRFIHSINVHDFHFGDVPPTIEIKDICDPLPDFYEDDESDSETDEQQTGTERTKPSGRVDQDHLQRLQEQILQTSAQEARQNAFSANLPRPQGAYSGTDAFLGLFPRSGTPGIAGGTSNLSYFHLPTSGLSGTQTPLAALAGGNAISTAGWVDHNNHLTDPSNSTGSQHQGGFTTPPRPSTSSSVASPPDILSPAELRSPERDRPGPFSGAVKVSDRPGDDASTSLSPGQQASPNDLQVVSRVRYNGNVKLIMTAEILLDYPMPSFVGIPLKLSITGMKFDGMAILAYIRKRMHFCFLRPEDASMFPDAETPDSEVRDGGRDGQTSNGASATFHQGSSNPHSQVDSSLLREIHVETEIGRQESGKQALKNVGKVEKFVVEQVRRIFEEELVFPSFWTFLV